MKARTPVELFSGTDHPDEGLEPQGGSSGPASLDLDPAPEGPIMVAPRSDAEDGPLYERPGLDWEVEEEVEEPPEPYAKTVRDAMGGRLIEIADNLYNAAGFVTATTIEDIASVGDPNARFEPPPSDDPAYNPKPPEDGLILKHPDNNEAYYG